MKERIPRKLKKGLHSLLYRRDTKWKRKAKAYERRFIYRLPNAEMVVTREQLGVLEATIKGSELQYNPVRISGKGISKQLLVAEIERRRDESWLGGYTKEKGIIFDITDEILSFIDTLEVKEVDLKKEFDKCCENYIFDDEYDVYIARRFFELGMQVSNKAQKGE